MNRFKLKVSELTDCVLAMASLRGDITGRGDMLVDNDEYALAVVVRTVVESLLHGRGIPFAATGCGWRVGPTRLHKSELLALAARGILETLRTGIPGCDNALETDVFAGDIPDIRPHDI